MLGVDIGGTKTALLAWERTTDEVLAQDVFATPTEIGPEAMVDRLVAATDTLLAGCGQERASMRGIGVAVPGLVDAQAGVVLTAGNLAGWSRVPLIDLLEAKLHVPVVIEHDANAAALGERWRGAARNLETFAFVALGTGIGVGIVVNGRLYRGAHHAAGELGDLVVGRDFLGQERGGQGNLAQLIGGKTLRRRARQATGDDLSSADVISQARMMQRWRPWPMTWPTIWRWRSSRSPRCSIRRRSSSAVAPRRLGKTCSTRYGSAWRVRCRHSRTSSPRRSARKRSSMEPCSPRSRTWKSRPKERGRVDGGLDIADRAGRRAECAVDRGAAGNGQALPPAGGGAGCGHRLFPEAYIPGLRGCDFPVPEHDQARQREALDGGARRGKEHGVAVVIGMEWETAAGLHNVAFVVSRDGEVVGYQAKNQIPLEEEAVLRARRAAQAVRDRRGAVRDRHLP